MKSFFKPALLGVLTAILVFLIVVPASHADEFNDKYMTGYWTNIGGLDYCNCPIIHLPN